MSEPRSFFLRASMQKARYLAFMQAPPSPPRLNDHWQAWWNSRQMSGSLDLAKQLRAWDDACNQDIVEGWLAAEDTMAFSTFDEATETWEFGIIMCSENYTEILPLLVFCESVFPHTKVSADDFAIIYPYFWGDSNVMAYMRFGPEGAALSPAQWLEDVAPAHLAHVASRLGDAWKVFEARAPRD